MADLDEEGTSEQETPALTEAISAILSEVKTLKEQVTTLQESVDLEENPVDDGDNDDGESLSTRVASLGRTPAEQIKDSCRTLRQSLTSVKKQTALRMMAC